MREIKTLDLHLLWWHLLQPLQGKCGTEAWCAVHCYVSKNTVDLLNVEPLEASVSGDRHPRAL